MAEFLPIQPCLWFDDTAREAMEYTLTCSLIRGSIRSSSTPTLRSTNTSPE
ncbi:hypothetical protein SAMN05216274_10689 [Cryobacterium levicorallinum]|uniref:Uncharacterized protein n=1 Tax=Cryobacterium levicorallinum TaxID=995038 RepID=A0ABY1ED65_9MICO|nr:hypothetical protein SAMN05216274_10689 [Cryobacterium levicorallinum]